MSTISASTTSTTAFKVTSDTTGTLVFQTGASPTTAMSISSAQIISFTNPPTATGGGSVATNTAYGTSALAANTTGTFSTAVGYEAGKANTNGYSITAVGARAGWVVNGATNFTAVGTDSGRTSTTAASTSFFGANSGFSNTTGSYLVAVGDGALYSNTTASNNTAVGYQAGYSATTNGYNTFIGQTAGYSTTGVGNTFVGCTNASVGAGYFVTTGTKNTIIGGYHGNQGGLDIRTASNYIVLSDGDGNPRIYWNDVGHLFCYNLVNNDFIATFKNTGTSVPYGIDVQYSGVATNNTSSYFYRGYDAVGVADRFYVRSNGGIANYQANNVNLSDRREKTNFAPAGDYLAKICAIPVQTFNYIDQNLEEDAGLTLGVVAQDVQAVAPELVMESNWASGGEEPKMRLSIYQTDLQYALMKALQELKAEFDAYKATHP